MAKWVGVNFVTKKVLCAFVTFIGNVCKETKVNTAMRLTENICPT